MSATRTRAWFRAFNPGTAASLLLVGGIVAFAAVADPISPAPSAVQPGIPKIPQAGQGALRDRPQLVWDSANSRLERRSYQIYDPFADANFDLYWEPRSVESARPGPISGTGVLTWRQAGSVRYGSDSIVAQYRGEMVNGRAHGHGIFVDQTGLRYDGEWISGLMEGEGQLLLPNGDVYRGGFKAGRLHGQGLFIDAAGRVYEGGFAEGLRDGAARVAEPNGQVFSSVWKRDIEDRLQRQPAPEAWARLYRVQASPTGPANLAITVAVGGKPQFCCHSGAPSFGYASTSFADRIEIFPDAPRLLDVWRGRANIAIADPLSFDADRAQAEQYTLLNYNSNYNKTVSLQFGLENRGTKPVGIEGAYLDVARSKLDAQPALQSTELTPLSGQSLDFSIENYGWSPARNASLTFRFQNPTKGLQTDALRIHIGDVTEVGKFSFASTLVEFGVRIKDMPSLRSACESSAQGNQSCFTKLIASGAFGRLTDFVIPESRRFGLRAVGQFSYDWSDADGKAQSTSAPFDAFVPIGKFQSLAECEGGDFKDISSGRPFKLADNRAGYRIPIPLQASVGAGTISHWQIVLDADKSSYHELRIVLQFADGQEVASRKISLLLFRPNSYPASIRPFEPRC